MIVPDQLARVTAQADTPEQVIPYVCAVSELKPRMLGPCVGYVGEGELVLVAYPLHDPKDTGAMAEAVSRALRLPALRRITVIGPARLPQAPQGAAVQEDWYYSLPVPAPPPGQKLRNLLRRAGRDVTVERGGPWGEEHRALVRRYLEERPLAAGTRHIYTKLPRYLAVSSGSLLLSARLADGRLAAFSVGEYAGLRTAFYMFAFRDARLAPPGATDLLLSGLLDEARDRGQTLMNLGLGVNEGVGFFKRKWGAVPFLPYVQATWEIPSPGVLSIVRGLFGRRS
jgi:Acetyltransferase (GNAT) domain